MRVSIFQVMQALPSSGLEAVYVFPNPLRPSRGHSLMTMANLSAGASIRIYSLTGSLIRDLTAAASGMASWDGRNDQGESVSSGVYFVLVESDNDRKVLKIAIER